MGIYRVEEAASIMPRLPAKDYLLLSDPEITAELQAYIHSNMWAMDPTKLNKFTQNKLVPQVANKYVHHLVKEEMP